MSAAPQRTCYLNGELLPLNEATVSVLDRGFIFGDAVYEVIPAPGGQFFGLEQHLARMRRSLEAVAIPDPMDADQWRSMLARLLAAQDPGEWSVYVQVTRGVAERNHAVPPEVTPTVFAMCNPLVRRDVPEQVRAVTLEDRRWQDCDTKTTALLANILARHAATARDADDAILIRDGLVTEATSSNVFVVVDGGITTPPLSSHLLPGVTRGLLIEALASQGVDVLEQDIAADTLLAAEEIWLTSSTRDVACVAQLNGRTVGDGADYPLAQRALRALQTAARAAKAD